MILKFNKEIIKMENLAEIQDALLEVNRQLNIEEKKTNYLSNKRWHKLKKFQDKLYADLREATEGKKLASASKLVEFRRRSY